METIVTRATTTDATTADSVATGAATPGNRTADRTTGGTERLEDHLPAVNRGMVKGGSEEKTDYAHVPERV